MIKFWESSAWGAFHLIGVLLAALLAGNMLKRSVPFLRASLIPTSVLGGCMLIVVAGIYKAVTGDIMFDTEFFGGIGKRVGRFFGLAGRSLRLRRNERKNTFAVENGWKEKDSEMMPPVVLPGNGAQKKGRSYYECDVNYDGWDRGAERIVFSTDGLIYYTGDHYESFDLLYDGWYDVDFRYGEEEEESWWTWPW